MPPPARPPRVTITDVARAAGVSRQTVSNSVNRPDRVRPDTLTRVLGEVDRLGYRPSSAAQTLRHQRAGAIGTELNAVSPVPSDIAFPFLVALTFAATRHGCHMVPFSERQDFPHLNGYQEMMRRRLVDAFVLSDTHPGDPRPGWLTAQGIPYASFGRVYDDPTATSWADVDGAAGTAEAVAHLRHQGYAEIAFAGWPQGSWVGDDRRRGWLQGLEAAGLSPGPEVTSSQLMPQARAAGDRLLEQLAPGGAVVCASDVIALGVQQAALARGLRPGADIGIVGFDGSGPARLQGISTLSQPLDRIAEHLLVLVHDQLEGAPAPDAGQLFLPTLTTGPSTERAPHRKAQP